ncbi:LLM class flavin-dependent oxidoreductase [Nocardia carnea]|uniref:LLM class flavin-dependent oxidoreductase n=1 Tax=Nocardia carnea TaxID=37328 RepID=UPI002453B59E|nr:LLM class flavin-dependent oxidoreductase [Nocardia carnea]
MSIPRIGVGLPTFGPHAGPDAVTLVARAAEQFGYHAVSVSERLLMPVAPATNLKDGLPESHVWDPLEVLTWAAAHTSRVRLMSGVVNSIFQPPIVLARRLATLDRLSRGRLCAGIGQGGGGAADSSWMIPEEFAAAGIPLTRRGAGFVEHVAAMRACWGPDPVEFEGANYHIPRSAVGPKPWGDTIPLYFGAMVRSTIERAARLADGFIAVALDWDDTGTKIGWYRDAGGTGAVVLNTLQFYPGGEPGSPAIFTDAVLADLDRAASAGADEMHITLNLASVHPERQVELLGALAATLDLTPRTSLS